MSLRFEWDKNKNESNFKKHKVHFDEAKTVFRDKLAKIFDDTEHSLTEDREIIIGHSEKNRLLIVSFTERAEDVIRIISARKATNEERKDYEENKRF